MYYLVDFKVKDYIIAGDDSDYSIEYLPWETFEQLLEQGVEIQGVSKDEETGKVSLRRQGLPIRDVKGEMDEKITTFEGSDIFPTPKFIINRVFYNDGVYYGGHLCFYADVFFEEYRNKKIDEDILSLPLKKALNDSYADFELYHEEDTVGDLRGMLIREVEDSAEPVPVDTPLIARVKNTYGDVPAAFGTQTSYIIGNEPNTGVKILISDGKLDLHMYKDTSLASEAFSGVTFYEVLQEIWKTGVDTGIQEICS